MDSRLRASEKTIAAVLKENGYATALTGKWHLGSTPDTVPNAHGFDYFYGFHEGCTDYFSHRYYWGDPRIVNFHDLWRNRDEIFEDGQYLTGRIADEAVQFIESRKESAAVSLCGVQCGALSDACAGPICCAISRSAQGTADVCGHACGRRRWRGPNCFRVGAHRAAGQHHHLLVRRQWSDHGTARGPESAACHGGQEHAFPRIQVQHLRWRHARARRGELARTYSGRQNDLRNRDDRRYFADGLPSHRRAISAGQNDRWPRIYGRF